MRVTLIVTLALAAPVAAQEAAEAPVARRVVPVVARETTTLPTAAPADTPADVASPGQRRKVTPPAEPAVAGPVRVVTPSRPEGTALDRLPALPEPWRGARAVRTEPDEAVVHFADGERTLRPGDRLGEATVREVGEGLIVLVREAVSGRPGGASRLIVRFDSSGRPHLRTIHEQDPTRVDPPVVR